MVYKSNYIFWGKLFSMIIAPYFKFLNLFRKKYNLQLIDIKTILVTEYHRIGDWYECVKEGAEMDEKVLVETTVSNRYCFWVADENQFVCRERSTKDEGWDEAKFIYFKVKP